MHHEITKLFKIFVLKDKNLMVYIGLADLIAGLPYLGGVKETYYF